jgi:hypothetical protein
MRFFVTTKFPAVFLQNIFLKESEHAKKHPFKDGTALPQNLFVKRVAGV